VTVEGVEPTNNAAEHPLRQAVLWRKSCFSADSNAGNTFVVRVLMVSATCRQQKRHLLTYLTSVADASRHGRPPPSFLPTL
jgi:hypothetical protein